MLNDTAACLITIKQCRVLRTFFSRYSTTIRRMKCKSHSEPQCSRTSTVRRLAAPSLVIEEDAHRPHPLTHLSLSPAYTTSHWNHMSCIKYIWGGVSDDLLAGSTNMMCVPVLHSFQIQLEGMLFDFANLWTCNVLYSFLNSRIAAFTQHETTMVFNKVATANSKSICTDLMNVPDRQYELFLKTLDLQMLKTACTVAYLLACKNLL